MLLKKDGLMTGKQKIQALTVSANYADFLRCIAPNIVHFDSWLVVTEEGDHATIKVCEQFGINYMFSKCLRKDGALFHKAAALNEGLETLDQDAWVIVLDSDILLPSDFRQRLDRQTLDPECLYGLGARRVCDTYDEFIAVADQEPWADHLIHTTFVIGYFNMFHLKQERNRYPDQYSKDASTYDVIFSDSFPVTHRRYLPFTCLHAGEASQNWGGRITAPFFKGDENLNARPEDSTLDILRGVTHDMTVAQIGCYSGRITKTLSDHFGKVVLVDHWGIFAKSKSISEPLAIDTEFIRDKFTGWTRDLTNVTPPMANSHEQLEDIEDGSLDVIWLVAEPEYDFLLHFLPAWLPKLKPGGSIVGSHYHEQLSSSFTVVNLLFGVPHQVFPDSRWILKVEDPLSMARRLSPVHYPDRKRGVVYVSVGDDVEDILVSITSLRHHWDGPICVLSTDPTDSASLQLACVKIGVEYRESPIPEHGKKYPKSLKVPQALNWSPFEETVYLAPHILVRGSVDFIFHDIGLYGCSILEGRNNTKLRVFGWHRNNDFLDTLIGMISTFQYAFPEKLVVPMAIQHNTIHRASGKLWDGPSKRIPGDVPLQDMWRASLNPSLYREWSRYEYVLLEQLTHSTRPD